MKINLRPKLIFPAGLLALIGLAIYSNSFNVPFQFDDEPYIVENPTIRNFPDLSGIIEAYGLFRVIGYLTFAINYHLHGLEVLGYHVVNVGIHLMNAILLWWLTRLLLSSPKSTVQPLKQHGEALAFCAALIFLAHPLQTQAVTYIMQRFASLATLFYLLSVCLYLKARLGGLKPYLRIVVLVASLMSALLAMFTKQIAFTLPFCILMAEWMFVPDSKERRRWIRVAVPAIILLALIVPALYRFNFRQVFFVTLEPGNYIPGDINAYTYLCTQFRVLVKYISLFFLPIGQTIDHYMPVSRGFFEGQTFASAAFLLLLLAFGAKVHRRHPLVSFGIYFFFLTSLVESSVIPIRHVIFEHRAYLPLAGLSISAVFTVYELIKNKNFFLAVIGIIGCILMILTYQRNKVWQDPIVLWKDAIEKAPLNPRPYYNLGYEYMKKKDNERALQYFNKALMLNPGYLHVLNNRANIYIDMGKGDMAFNDLNKAIEAHPQQSFLYATRGTLYQKSNDCDQAIKDFSKAIELNTQMMGAYSNRGICYGQKGLMQLALDDFNKAIEVEPGSYQAYSNRGTIYLRGKQFEAALQDFSKAIEINRRYVDAFYNRALTYLILDKKDLALLDFTSILQVEPGHINALLTRGEIYQQMNKHPEALSDFNKVLDLRPNHFEALSHRVLTLMLREDFHAALLDFSKIIEINPKLAQAYTERGKLYYRLKVYKKAKDDYDMALLLDTGLAEVYFLRSLVEYELKEYNSAWADINKAKELGHLVDAFYLLEFERAQQQK